MRKPPHPGEFLREDIMPVLGMSVTELADHLGVGPVAMSRLVNERQGISIDMAARLGKAFGQTTRFWAALQFEHDLWMAGKNEPPDVVPINWRDRIRGRA